MENKTNTAVEDTNIIKPDTEKISENTVSNDADKAFYEMDDEKSALRFKVLGLPTIIYSIVYGICLYKNLTGIMTPVFTIATVAYLWFVLPGLSGDMILGKEKLKKLIPYFTGIILLGISVFMTADIFLIVCNYGGIMLLVMTALIRFFCDEADWGVGKYVLAMIVTALMPLFNFHMFYSDRRSYRVLGNSKIKIHKNVKYVIIGIIFAIPFLVMVTVILETADAFFFLVIDSVVGKLSDSFHISWDIIGLIIFILCVLLIVYGLMCSLSVHGAVKYDLPDKKCNPVTGITFCSVLNAVYLLFSGIQILRLFRIEKVYPEWYGSYARDGFYQLLKFHA
ncbi:MAG: DUF4173 domain-containing protein, partial [Lachnospiraceae bacterium]|nr:DUF4173 domain-containing protein [Lachnospiraceae bacterium]